MVGDVKLNKKYIFRMIIIVVILLGLTYFLYRIPKEFRKEYQGIYYQLGNPDFSEKVTVSFEGYLTRRLWQEDIFEGNIRIGDQEMTNVKLYMGEDMGAYVSYLDKGTHDFISYGTLYTEDIKKGFTIYILKKDENNPGYSSWSGENGYMISAPASNRSEALELTKRMMEQSPWKELK